MTTGINVTVESIGSEKLVAKFNNYVGRLRPELNEAMQTITNYLVAYVKENKLSGQVLKRHKGDLARSIKPTVIDQPAQIIGIVTSRDSGNAPLPYARFWELGFHGTMNVRAHIRKNASGGFSDVRAFVRTVNQNARPFLKPTRDENKEYVQRQLQKAVKRANS
jgi:hypothetical protein